MRLFIERHVDSIAQLELIELLHDHPDKEWVAHEVAAELRGPVTWATVQLDRMRGLGIARMHGEGTYVYDPDRRMAKVAEKLTEALKTDRAAVANLVFAPPDPARAFSDAFRLRRRKD